MLLIFFYLLIATCSFLCDNQEQEVTNNNGAAMEYQQATQMETEHFYIAFAHWLEYGQYNIQPKAKTLAESKELRAMLPHTGLNNAANTAEELIDRLKDAEAWYVNNRNGIIKQRQQQAERRAARQ